MVYTVASLKKAEHAEMFYCFINNALIPRLQNKIKSDFCKFYYYCFLQSCQFLDFNKCTQGTFKILVFHCKNINEPQHDKTNKIAVRPAKIRISLGIRPV